MERFPAHPRLGVSDNVGAEETLAISDRYCRARMVNETKKNVLPSLCQITWIRIYVIESWI